MTMIQQYLPGCEPACVRIELRRDPNGLYDVMVTVADDPRYPHSGERDDYPQCSAGEAGDVVVATLAFLGFE